MLQINIIGTIVVLAGLIHTVKGDEYCPNAQRVSEIAKEVAMIRLAMKGLISECTSTDIFDDSCECPAGPQTYTVAVTGEGCVGKKEVSSLNITTSLFSINGQPIFDPPRYQRGISIVAIQRETQEVSEQKTFDIWGDRNSKQGLIDYLDEVKTDSILLVSVLDLVIVKHWLFYRDMWDVLMKYGMINRFSFFDSMAFIGFKAEPGLCNRVPNFITESYAKGKKKQDRNGLCTEPVTATAEIPFHCDLATTNIDFEVTIVSEGGKTGIEYIASNENPSLFLVNGKRVLGAPWYNGLNIVVLDPATRTLLDSTYFDMRQPKKEKQFKTFIDSQPDKSLILVTLWVEMGVFCKTSCRQTLESLGADYSLLPNSFLGNRDSYSLIGFKGNCENGIKPNWIKQSHSPASTGNTRGLLRNEIQRTTSAITYPLCK